MSLTTERSAVLGQRERNKLDKLRRIKDAAREFFVAKGFDDTTTREIAPSSVRRRSAIVAFSHTFEARERRAGNRADRHLLRVC